MAYFIVVSLWGDLKGSLHITTLLRIFALLIEKDGGIRPCDVLATCASQGATFYLSALQQDRKDKRKSFITRLFDISIIFRITPIGF